MSISNLSDKNLEIGTIFTPVEWGLFAIKQFGVFEKWIDGATIFDPTMGEGNLLLSLIEYGINQGYSLHDLPINRLFGVELNTKHYDKFFEKAKKEYNLELSKKNFRNDDIFFIKEDLVFDIMLGNPPWQNFVDLPDDYKKNIKGLFFLYDLVGNAQDLLLGGSRIDIAALVLQKTIQKNLAKGGEAIFFVPLSLFLNGGANTCFRKYNVNGIRYCVDKILDFNTLEIFDGVGTRYGLIHIVRDSEQRFPIEYQQWSDGGWKALYAKPIFQKYDPLSISSEKDCLSLSFNPITVEKYSQPRQGINTGGANDIFFFDSYADVDSNTCKLGNKTQEAVLPKKYIYPLITSKNFNEENPVPRKWALVPHNRDGKPFNEKEARRDELLWKYLNGNKQILQNRKGLLINVWIKKNVWWALMGVGEYSFSPYKIVWEAYGKNTFSAKMFSGDWQANQSLQAFMPARSVDGADEIIEKLTSGEVQNYLLSQKMEGTMNWAQPGKIKKMLKFVERNLSLFPV